MFGFWYGKSRKLDIRTINNSNGTPLSYIERKRIKMIHIYLYIHIYTHLPIYILYHVTYRLVTKGFFLIHKYFLHVLI